MMLLTHAPAGPWPEFGTCPCCGQPWPFGALPAVRDPYGAPEEGTDLSSWGPWGLSEDADEEEPPEDAPTWLAAESGSEEFVLPVSGVGLGLLRLLSGEGGSP